MNNQQKIISLLKRYDEPYWTHGNNVSVGAINIKCPYCNDKSNHMGIFIEELVCSCWRCQRKPPFFVLLAKLSGLSVDECQGLVEDHEVDFTDSAVKQIQNILHPVEDVVEKVEVKLPEGCLKIEKDDYFGQLKKYLDKRNISIDTLIEHNCYRCLHGDFCGRVVIPVYFEGELVSYQGADITGYDETKYKTASGHINDYLYNYDNIDDIMIVTEGILDAWRIGESAVATFGTSLTCKQQNLILKKKLSHLIFVWDGETYLKAKKEAEFFRPLLDNISIIKLPGKSDPDELGTEKVWEYILEGIT